MRLWLSMSSPRYSLVTGIGERTLLPRLIQIVIDHAAHQSLEVHARGPSERLPRFRGITEQKIDFSRPKVTGVGLDEFAPVQTATCRCLIEELGHRMRLSRRDDEIVGRRLL